MKAKIWRWGLCFLLCFCLALPMASRADFGSFSGDSDYGGSWDSDYGSSWSGDSDWDSGDGEFSLGGTIFGLFVTIIIVAVVVPISISRDKRRARRLAAQNQGTSWGRKGGAPASGMGLMPMERYNELDPLFSRAALSEKLANLYVQMQTTWQAKNIESIRPYLTDALFNQMNRQLATLRQQGRTNYIDRIAVLGVNLKGYYQSGGEDHIIAEVRTRIVDYTLEDATGRLVSGDQRKERFMTYEWDLVRPTGKATLAQEAMHHVSCPSCGAPLSINQSAKCDYCGTVVTLADHDWVIYAIKGISQVTR